MCISLIGLISLGIWFYLDHRPRPAPKIPLSKVYADMWNAQKKLPPEDQEWFDAVSSLAGIPDHPHTYSPAPKQSLHLSGGTPTGQIIEVGDTRYQKYSTPDGFCYLKEMETVTVRGMSGKILQ
jgi:hypothetical protein